MPEIYRAHLAFVHHRGFAGQVRSLAPVLLKLLRARGLEGGHVVDLGCGDGAWLRVLARAGFAATGVEQSAALVRLARRAAPGATVRRASLHDIVLPRCDALTALGEVLNYLPPGTGRKPAASGARGVRSARRAPLPLRRWFRRAHAALRPGGLLIFDLLVAGRPMNYETSAAGHGWTVRVRVAEDVRRGRLTRTIVTTRRRGDRETRQTEVHRLRVPRRETVLADLRRAGFTARAARRLGTHRLLPRRVAFVARRPFA